MQFNYPNQRIEDAIREVQELEDSYAEALGDGADARSLSVLWERIQLLNREIENRHTSPQDVRSFYR